MPGWYGIDRLNQKPRAGFDDVGRGTLVERGGAGARQRDVQTTDRLALVGELVRAHAVAFVGQCDPEIAQVLQDRLLLRVRGGLNCPLAVRRLLPRVYLGTSPPPLRRNKPRLELWFRRVPRAL